MWNWRQFNDINSGKRYPAKFDNRNKFDITIGWNINDKIELTGQWEYMTGNRATLSLYNVAPPDVAFPDAPFVSPLDRMVDVKTELIIMKAAIMCSFRLFTGLISI